MSDLESYVREDLLPYLWTLLAEARLSAARRAWSIRVEDLANVIRRLTNMVGPVDPRKLGMPFLMSMGNYEGIGYRESARRAGIPARWLDADEESAIREQCEKYLGRTR